MTVMLNRLFTHRMLGPESVPPTDDRFKVIGVLNPGVVSFEGRTAILARVVQAPVETRDDAWASPKIGKDGGLEIDWLPKADVDGESDPRCYFHRKTGQLRLRFISHLQVFYSDDGKRVNTDAEIGKTVMPVGPYETFGIEDPRITPIDGTFYITAVAVSPKGVCTALLSTTNFQHFTRHGVILPPDNKDVLLLPEKVTGDYVAIHRPMPNMPFSPPQMWTARSPDLIHWGAHRQISLGGQGEAFQDRVGGSTPPIMTDRGWLMIYHGSNKEPGAKGAGVYSAGVLLLDPTSPSRVIGRSKEPIMLPTEDFEKEGFVPNVVFPSGIVRHGRQVYVYYGAADESVGVCGFDIEQLLNCVVEK